MGILLVMIDPIKPAKAGEGPAVWAKAQVPLRGWRWGGLHHPISLAFPWGLAWVYLGDNPPSGSQHVTTHLYYQPWVPASAVIP